MLINSTNFNGSQNFSFYGSKLKAAKLFKTKNIINSTTLRDKFNNKNKTTKNFEFTYDRLLRECEEFNKQAIIIKQIEATKTLFKQIIQQLKYQQKAFFGFYKERENFNKDLYNKLIARCVEDIDHAISENKTIEEVDKLTSTLELFIRKYGHYDL